MAHKAHLLILAAGATIGAVCVANADVWTRGDVLPAVLAIGVTLPLGYTGIGLFRKRDSRN